MITTFKQVFDRQVKLNIGAGRKLTVNESDPSAKLKQLAFKLQRRHISDGASVSDSIFIELDKNTNPHEKLSYFFCSQAKHVNKRSDLVIYHEKQDYLAILICDLKSSPKGCDDDRAKKQFLNSKNFINYVNDIGSEYYEKKKDPEFVS